MSVSAGSPAIIDLTGAPVIGRGSHRCCYRHPLLHDRCIKVLIRDMTDEAPQRNLRRPGLLTRLRRAVGFRWRQAKDANAQEYEAFQRLAALGADSHFARCFGPVQTSQGPGLLCELVCQEDGTAAPMLREYLRQHGPMPADHPIAHAVAQFFDSLDRSGVHMIDINPANLVIAHPSASRAEDVGIVCVDCKSFLRSPGFAPFAFLPWSTRSTTRRRNRRLMQRITGMSGQ